MTMLEKLRAKQGLAPAGQPAASDSSPGSGATIAPTNGAAEPKKKPKRKPHPSSPAAKDAKTGRLPDGAKFTVVFSAKEQRWSGTLEIPDAGLLGELAAAGEAASGVFRGSALGVFRLLAKLDGEYRRWKGAPPAEDAGGDVFAQAVAQTGADGPS